MVRFSVQAVLVSGLVLMPQLAAAQMPAAPEESPADDSKIEPAPAPSPSSGAAGAAAISARELFQQGVTFSEQLRWLAAEQAFARSAELVPSAACLLNLAVTRFKLKIPLEGLAAIDRIEELALPMTAEQAERARGARQRLEQEVATMRLQLKPREAVVSLDGKELPANASTSLRLNPGQHDVLARAPGYLDAHLVVELGEGERRTVELVLAPTPASAAQAEPPELAGPRVAKLAEVRPEPAPKDRSLFTKPWFWVGAGVLVAAGVVATALAVSSSGPEPTSGSERHVF